MLVVGLVTVSVQLHFVSITISTRSHVSLFTGIVRRAVALGRFLQNPVTMVASLCGPTKEILSLRLHPMQNSLTNEELYEAIERVMVTVVNQVGSVSFACNGVLFVVVATCCVPISAATGSFKLSVISLDLLTSSCHDSYVESSIYILKN